MAVEKPSVAAYHGPVKAFAGRGKGVLESSGSANVTSDISRGGECTAVVLLRLEDDNVHFRQEEQHQGHRRRRTDRKTVNDRSALKHTTKYLPSVLTQHAPYIH